MPTPTPRPEADMLHMQHAHVVAQIVRQHDAARRQAQRDAVAEARRAASAAGAAEPETQPGLGRRARKIHLPRPA